MNNNGNGYGADDGLATLSQEGQVPETRMRDAAHVQDWVQRLWDDDSLRSWTRSQVRGLVDGNPPFRPSRLKAAGRGGATNVNFGTGRTYLEAATGAFYDLTSEAPGLIAIRTSTGKNDTERDEHSRVMSTEADRIIQDDSDWDYDLQRSQQEMVFMGSGPLMFEDAFKVLPISVSCGDLKVPERTPATTSRWEAFAVDKDYYPPELYDFIRDEEAATKVGWDVEFTKKVIANAMDVKQPSNRQNDWEFYQQEIKNNSLSYINDSKVCHLEFVFWREFDGLWTQAIVERMGTGSTETKYLYFRRGRYQNIRQIIHPMYQDRGNGGFHHAVTGLGVKMFGAMENENRLLCKLYDDVFAPKILFKPTTAEAAQKIQLNSFGSWGVLSAGADAIQNPIQGFINDGLAMFRATSDLMRSNLSSYRQQVATKQEGNPPTARQISLDATQASALGKTTINRYYRQMDFVYEEIVRRLCNLNNYDPRATLYRERCMRKGVPPEAFGRVELVRAVRVVGEGSPFLRKESISGMISVVGSMPEEGRNNWLNDFIGATCGQSSVHRYNPEKKKNQLQDDQTENAMLQVAAMKVGVPPVITSSQNALRYAGVFLTASVQAAQSIQQGANPAEVMKFLDLSVPAVISHVQRVMNDPIRNQAAKVIMKQVEQLSKIAEQLKKQLGKQQQQQKQQAQKTQRALSDVEIKKAEVQGKLAIQAAKAQHQMKLKEAATRQRLTLDDASTASEISRKNRLASLEE